MLYEVITMFDYCDAVAYEDMTQAEYKNAIGDCIRIRNNFV